MATASEQVGSWPTTRSVTTSDQRGADLLQQVLHAACEKRLGAAHVALPAPGARRDPERVLSPACRRGDRQLGHLAGLGEKPAHDPGRSLTPPGQRTEPVLAVRVLIPVGLAVAKNDQVRHVTQPSSAKASASGSSTSGVCGGRS